MTAERDTPAEEAMLVSAAVRGDREAIGTLWKRHRRWVAAVLLTYKPREADLEDLLQEVAMRLLSKIDTLREESNIRAWLRAVAVNVARSAGRSTRGTLRFQGEDVTALTRNAATPPQPEGQEQARRIIDFVSSLPDHYREPLVLRAVNGLRTKEIAAILDLPPATIDTRIARARRMLLDRAERGAGQARSGNAG